MPVTGPGLCHATVLPCICPLNASRFRASDHTGTYEGVATTLFGHSEPVKKLVWRLQSVERDQLISWEEFLDFAEQKEHIPGSKEEWCVVPDCNSGHQLVRVGRSWCP